MKTWLNVPSPTVRPELVEACPEPSRRVRPPLMLRQAQHERGRKDCGTYMEMVAITFMHGNERRFQ